MDEQPMTEVEAEPDTIEMSGRERRACERAVLRVPVTVNSVTTFRGESRDISPGGIFVALGDELPVGSLIDVQFRVPGVEHPFEVLGEVRWARFDEHSVDARTAGIGVEFLDLSRTGQDVIVELLGSPFASDATYEALAVAY